MQEGEFFSTAESIIELVHKSTALSLPSTFYVVFKFDGKVSGLTSFRFLDKRRDQTLQQHRDCGYCKFTNLNTELVPSREGIYHV